MPQLKSHKSFKQLQLPHPTILFFAFTRFFAFFFSFPCITDIPLYFKKFTAAQIEGLAAYKDFAFEYPPLALVPIYLPKLFLNTSSLELYWFSYMSIMMCIDVFCFMLCRFYCKNRLKMSQDEVNYFTLIYSLFGLLLFRVIYHRLDVIVATFFVVSLLLFRAERPKIGFGFFVNSLAGLFYKIVPVFNAPIAIIFKAFNRHQGNSKKVFLSISLGALILIFCIIVSISILQFYTEGGFIKNMIPHQKRGIQIESIIGSFLLFKGVVLGSIPFTLHEYGSWNVRALEQLEFVSKVLGSLMLLCFYASLIVALFYKKKYTKKIFLSEENFLEATLITILLTLSFQRVLSPQFFIWLIPFVAIWMAKNRTIKNLLAFSFLFFTTFFIFSSDPFNSVEGQESVYFAMLNQEAITITMLFLRNVLLLILTYSITKNFFQKLISK
jgi:hypothetical protein